MKNALILGAFLLVIGCAGKKQDNNQETLSEENKPALYGKHIRSTQLSCCDLEAAIRTYYPMCGTLPFDTKNYTVNQNDVMVDNMTNPDYRWIQQRGYFLETRGGQYRFSKPEGQKLREVQDHWGNAYVIKVLAPDAPPSVPAVDHLIVKFGSVKVFIYSTGPDGVDQCGKGDNDDIGPGGCVRNNK
jgi:hypothetical protein